MLKFSTISYFRNFVFGVEDSLVSTAGLLSGIAVAGIPKTTILLTGIILIFVEAISMAAGSFISEYSVEEYINHTEKPTRGNIISGIIMFFSYFFSGIIPLLPYVLLPVESAFGYSIILSISALFLLGIIGAKISGIHMLKNGLKMACIGGVAISIGIIAGNILSAI